MRLTFGTGGQCLLASGGTGTAVGACASAPPWSFAATGGGMTLRSGGRCLDGGGQGTAAELWPCDGSAEQVWTLAAQGSGSSLKNRRFGTCLQGSGTAATLAACSTAAAAQLWKGLR